MACGGECSGAHENEALQKEYSARAMIFLSVFSMIPTAVFFSVLVIIAHRDFLGFCAATVSGYGAAMPSKMSASRVSRVGTVEMAKKSVSDAPPPAQAHPYLLRSEPSAASPAPPPLRLSADIAVL